MSRNPDIGGWSGGHGRAAKARRECDGLERCKERLHERSRPWMLQCEGALSAIKAFGEAAGNAPQMPECTEGARPGRAELTPYRLYSARMSASARNGAVRLPDARATC